MPSIIGRGITLLQSGRWTTNADHLALAHAVVAVDA